MKIVILNTSELTGGAAVAANRLMKALNEVGIESSMLVRDKRTDDPRVFSINESCVSKKINFWRFLWERLILFIHNGFDRKKLFQVSIANTGSDISKHPCVTNADIIHIHWINQGFLSLKDIGKLIKLNKPIVWTMHDMWPCTGICHHAYECEGFTKNCGNCNFLNSHNRTDLSYKTLQKKSFILNSGIHMVTVSSWLKKQAERSRLTSKLNISVIPNVIDISIFKPADKKNAREAFGIPLDKKVLLVGAARLDDSLKGFEFLQAALQILEGKENILLVLFGSVKHADTFFSQIPVTYQYMGLMKDMAQIAQLCAAADILVVPSHYETFGQTIIEAMACGCPAVTFDNSGQTDIVDHLKNGYLAKYKNVEDLASGIQWALKNCDNVSLVESCVEKVHSLYQESVVTKQYIHLYEKLLKSEISSDFGIKMKKE